MSTRGRSRRPRTSNSVSGRMTPRRPAVDGDAAVGVGVAQHAEIRAPERLEAEGRGLGDLAGGLDLVVEDDEHAEPARLRRGGHADRAHEVHPGVGAEPAGRPLGAHDDDRDVVVHGEVQEVGRLLERRRAMRDHHAVERGFTRGHGVNRLGQEQPLGGSDGRAPDATGTAPGRSPRPGPSPGRARGARPGRPSSRCPCTPRRRGCPARSTRSSRPFRSGPRAASVSSVM